MAATAEKSSTTASAPPQAAVNPPISRKAGEDDFFAPAGAARASSELVDIATNFFAPSQKVSDEIEAQGAKGLDVGVVVKGLTGKGRVKIRVDKKKTYDSMSTGSMPLLNPWTQQLGGMYINFKIINSEVRGGFASLKPGAGDANDWLQAVQKNTSLLGGLGLKVENLPTPVNKFDNGKITLGVTNLKVQVGGYLDSVLSFSVENLSKPKIDATADINIKGAVKGQLKLDNAQDKLSGQVSLSVDYKSFSGAAVIKYNVDGTVDVGGKAAYNADKLSGEIQFVSTDLDSANKFARDAIAAAGGKENVQQAAAPAAVPLPKAGKRPRALAATGQLGFNLTTWFAGTVNVVVDGKGAVTVIGKIAPPAEIELFKQRDWDKELVKFEAKAYYGIPVVGNLNLFANISLHALAKLGPAKIYNIEILGTYSTDPEIQKSIQISGSINISAYAGLRLRAEGGAGIEIASHDLKFGVGLNADIGVKAYADARPTIGYRDPGVFYISGTLEMVAQPMLGLGGDFFIELETPWWSPLSDDKWIWPLFSKEWPLTDPIGLSATVKDYVLGSGTVPEIELKKPEFDPSKFMTNMVDRTLPDKSGGPGAGQGAFKEDGSVPKPEVKPKKPAPKPPAAKPGKKGAAPKKGKSASPDSKAAKDLQNTKGMQNAATRLAGLKGKAPFTRTELDSALAQIKGEIAGVEFSVQLKGTKWSVAPKAGGKTGKGLVLDAKPAGKDQKGKPDERSEAESDRDKLGAIAAAEKLLPPDEFDEEEMRQKLAPIRIQFRLLTLDLEVESSDETSETFHFAASASKKVRGKGKKRKLRGMTPRLKAGDYIKNLESNSRITPFEYVTVLDIKHSGGRRFSTQTAAKQQVTHSYAARGRVWIRQEFKFSDYVEPAPGPFKFVLKTEYRGNDPIRRQFYKDNTGTRNKLVALRLEAKDLYVDDKRKEFFSEAKLQDELDTKEPFRVLKGEALIPVGEASADHHPPLVKHWSELGGNDTDQQERERHNKDIKNIRVISWKLNIKKGPQESGYVKEVGLKFRGPDEK